MNGKCGKETYELVGYPTCNKVLDKYPNYKVFWRSGYAYRGAAEVEDNKSIDKYTFEERMRRRYTWAAAIDITIDHEKKEIHFNGFSANDLY